MATIAVATNREAVTHRLNTALADHSDELVHIQSSGELLAAALDGSLHMVILDMQTFGNTALPLITLLDGEFRTPVVALTDAFDQDPNAVFRAGAVEVLNFFASAREISTRVSAAMVRAERAGITNVVHTGELEFNLATDELTLAGEPVHLTRTEAALFRMLAANLGQTVSDRELLEQVWGPEYIDAVEYLRVYVGYIRQKIDANPGSHSLANSYIGRERGRGYRLQAFAGCAPRRSSAIRTRTAAPTRERVLVS